MPTFSKLICGALLAALAVLVSEMVKPNLPSAYDVSRFDYTNAAIAFAMGWKLVGRQAGRGIWNSIANGITAVASTVFLVLLFYSIGFMVQESFKSKYDNIFEAIDGMLGQFVDLWEYINYPQIFAVLAVGMVVIGMAGEYTKRRWD